ncbi:hypothetical protein FIU82_13115 [Pseudoalteromonas sp. THAF3]|uniref:copper chaperone PCu(A)C n=1 Tax=Pseudoalteromonas TaxID=53246 RepID=UPI00034874D3|nr:MULTISPECIES: copper chaperone PCu(A)C [Pseudoalteromonas]MCG7570567.1 copper chaperone PCu(A)C [Pseudoalteromonas sp. CNC9-20]QFU05927.1 hypothetical protein FIU82_13115 [Pseudoalteromonas sp. THAF3]TLX52013.1 copper chaperone PCu(A)C [Pseudoalteromonas ruthenica]|tara:strand:+ start:20980 stop:21465 length:486 start_codon:yes stop_codon:yes gene_type:complete
MLRTTLGTLICAVSLLLSFHSAAHGELMVSEAKVRTFLPASESSVGYLTLMNHSDHDRVLKKVEIETLGRVEIHTHEHKNGMMQMRKLEELQVPAHQTLVFQPGGLHLMLFAPSQKLVAGEQLKMTLYFADGDRVFTQARIYNLLEQSQDNNSDEHQHHHH